MSEKKINSNLALIIITVTAVFLIIEGLIWTNQIKIEALGNLSNGADKLLENPAFVGLVATVIVGATSGFMQKVFKKNETFDLKSFGETFYYYEPLLILVAQFIPVHYAVVLLFVIDVMRRVLLKLVPKTT
jgi:hypothetical protein